MKLQFIGKISLVLIILIPLSLAIFFIIQSNSISQPTDNSSETIPTINIDLNGKSIELLNSDYEKKSFNVSELKIIENNEQTIFNNLEIKSHGNSTWEQIKKPYQIKFPKNTTIFGFEKAKKWLLLANYLDPSHLKNDTAFYLEKVLNQKFAIDGQFTNLYINNSYLGLYYLTEKIELGKNRIHLTNPDGILVEYEGLHSFKENTCYEVGDASCLTIKDVVNHDRTESAMVFFIKKYESLYEAVKNNDYETIQNLADMDSFAKYYILSDITLNPDSYTSSYFFYMDGPNDKIHIGPGWDFDLAFESTPSWGINYGINYFSPYKTIAKNSFSSDNASNQEHGISNDSDKSESMLMYYLLQIPEFTELIKVTYNKQIKNHETSIIQHIDDKISLIATSAEKNNTFWEQSNFMENAIKHRNWLQERLNYLTLYYNDSVLSPDTPETDI